MMRATFVVCVSGFTQSRGRYHGILKLREELLVRGASSGAAHRVEYLTWKTNFKRVVADFSIICSQHGFKPSVMIVGYSYGGWGAIQLAAALEGLGISVEKMVLCDPVGRPWYWPRPLPALSSMLGRKHAPALKIPSNVREVWSFYQQNNRPQGHRLTAKQHTKLHPPVALSYVHDRMDDAPEFHAKVLEQVQILMAESGAVL